MPTGYTSELYDGEQSFKDFALRCARAFGATIEQRENPLDEKPILPHADMLYRQNQGDKYRADIDYWKNISLEEADQRAEESYRAALTAYEDVFADAADRAIRYADMIGQIKAWDPPSEDHTGLKTFMLDQLENVDSAAKDLSYTSRQPLPQRLTAKAFREQRLRLATETYERFQYRCQKEDQRFAEKRKWISDLFDSLGVENEDS